MGFGSGLERVTLVMQQPLQISAAPLVYVVSFTEEARGQAFLLAQRLRHERMGAELDLAGRSPKGQLKQAARSGAKAAVLLGLPEAPQGTVRLRDLQGGADRDVAEEALVAELRPSRNGQAS